MSSKKISASPEAIWAKKNLKLTFRKTSLFEAAVTHPSYRYENNLSSLEDFDRLEFFGDTILNFVVCRQLYKLFPKADEGMLSKLRSILVSRKILSRIARSLHFLKVIRLAKHLKRQKDFSKDKLLADTFEAVLAALFFDKGLPQTEKFILKHVSPYFDAKKLFRIDPNPKSTLQEICQRRWQRLPVYQTDFSKQPLKTTVMITPRYKASAIGKNRKESEEKAARALIKKIGG